MVARQRCLDPDLEAEATWRQRPLRGRDRSDVRRTRLSDQLSRATIRWSSCTRAERTLPVLAPATGRAMTRVSAIAASEGTPVALSCPTIHRSASELNAATGL